MLGAALWSVGPAIVAISLLLVSGCAQESEETSSIESPVPASSPSPTDDREPETINWERAVQLIGEGKVSAVVQAHSRQVHLRLTDGTEYLTTEPRIDDVNDHIREAPNADSIQYATE